MSRTPPTGAADARRAPAVTSSVAVGWWPLSGYALASALGLMWIVTSLDTWSDLQRELVWGAVAGCGLMVFLAALVARRVDLAACDVGESAP